MKRLIVVTVGALLAMPASALAGSGKAGVVLSIDGKHRTIEVVDSSHVVHSYHYRGRLPKLHAGTKINFKLAGKDIVGVKAVAQGSHSVSFYARVVSSNKKGVVLQLADGRRVGFSSKALKGSKHIQRHARFAGARVTAGNITINIQGLEPGVTVLVTETVDAHGNVTITISLPRGAGGPGQGGGEQHASGVVTEVDDDAFVVETGDGSDLRLHIAADRLSNLGLSVCDTVTVAYHQTSGILVADRVNDTGTSSTGDCADQSSEDETGAITQVSGDSVTIDTQDNGSMTFSVDSSDITDGFQVGDVVDVTYTDNGDGTYDASDVEYVEQDETGTVTAVSDGSLTFTDDSTGQPVTVTADPSDQMFDGVLVGDQVEVTYHQSNGQFVADNVDDSGGGD